MALSSVIYPCLFLRHEGHMQACPVRAGWQPEPWSLSCHRAPERGVQQTEGCLFHSPTLQHATAQEKIQHLLLLQNASNLPNWFWEQYKAGSSGDLENNMPSTRILVLITLSNRRKVWPYNHVLLPHINIFASLKINCCHSFGKQHCSLPTQLKENEELVKFFLCWWYGISWGASQRWPSACFPHEQSLEMPFNITKFFSFALLCQQSKLKSQHSESRRLCWDRTADHRNTTNVSQAVREDRRYLMMFVEM